MYNCLCIKFHISLSVCLCLTILHRDVPYFPSIFFIILKIKTNCWQTDVDGDDTPPPPSDYTMEDYKAIFLGGTTVKTTLNI